MVTRPNFARLDARAKQEGAAHADRVLKILATLPREAAEEVLDLGALTLGEALDKTATVLRKHTGTPESEIEHFAALVKAAYDVRMAVALMPAPRSA